MWPEKIILILHIQDILLTENGAQEVTSTINFPVNYMCAKEQKINTEKVQWFAKSVKFVGVHGKMDLLKYETNYST